MMSLILGYTRTREDFNNYRKDNIGSHSDAAFAVWDANGGKDKPGYKEKYLKKLQGKDARPEKSLKRKHNQQSTTNTTCNPPPNDHPTSSKTIRIDYAQIYL